MFRDVIELISTVITKDAIGQEIENDIFTEVFAEKNGITRSELMSVGVKDIKPELMFKIREIEYSDQDRLRYNSKIYSIYKVFPIKSEMIELYCEVRANG